MKKKIFSLIILICMLLLQLPSKAQYVLKEADQAYQLFNYSRAVMLYQKAYNKKKSLHAAERLGQSYLLINDYPKAQSWYALAVQMPGSKAENILAYAEALQNNGKYAEAKEQYLLYSEKNTAITQQVKQAWIVSCDSALAWMKNPKELKLREEKGLNSAKSEWGAVPYQGGVVFTSDRPDPGTESRLKKPFLKFDGARLPDRKIYGWTGNGYLRLYYRDIKDSLILFPFQAVNGYHTGSASFTADGRTMYYSLTKIPENPVKSDSVIHIGIYSSKMDSTGQWGIEMPFSFNKGEMYSVLDPFITPEGKRLYFASDKPGGHGGTDLYYCDQTASGDWGEPVNIQSLNTKGYERSPFIDENGNFYFSSDGRIGMGGLDVYAASKEHPGVAVNLGYPLNSPGDDFAFNLDMQSGLGYLSSNRNGGTGSDDVYALDAKSILTVNLSGQVYDQHTKLLLTNASVSLMSDNGVISSVSTDGEGRFNFILSRARSYTLKAEKPYYAADALSFTTGGFNATGRLEKNLFLVSLEINKAIRLENIYYDFDQWGIRADATEALDKLIAVLKDYPQIKIELSSHTDSRGKDHYNQLLSQKRAVSALNYILSKGIDKERVSAVGYGETQLLNRCANGVKCTEEDHQLNRRTEFKIIK